MNKELLILDMDETLKGYEGCFDGVGDFLKRQSEKRECVIATFRNGSKDPKENLELLESEFGDFSPYIHSIYPRRIIGDPADFCKIDGKFIPKQRIVGNFKIEDIAPYRNPFVDANLKKDLYLVRSLHSFQNDNLPNSVFIGDDDDVDAASTDPDTPAFIVGENKWAVRKNVEMVLEKFFTGSETKEVFDELYSGGVATGERLIGTTWHEHAFILMASVKVEIANTNFKLSKILNGKEVRIIEEIVGK
jgi:hypothetical protein